MVGDHPRPPAPGRPRRLLRRGWLRRAVSLSLVPVVALSGCTSLDVRSPAPNLAVHGSEAPPNELSKVSLPTYRIEPPDILLIDAIKLVPKPPYHIEVLDELFVSVSNTLPDQPIQGAYRVDPSGSVALGPAYGSVQIVGLTVDEATAAITEQLEKVLRAPEVSVSLAAPAAQQAIQGEHLVGPDGTVNLGVYGAVYVAGMTLEEAKAAIEDALGEQLEAPEVSLDVFAYNSKVYYVITQGLGAGQGDNIIRVPITGNETVLDAVAQVQGLQPFSSKKVWIARPSPDDLGHDQLLLVDWSAITQGASTATNYQLLPGDRLFIAENKMLAMGYLIETVTAPVESLFGFSLLGIQTIQTANRLPLGFRGAAGLGGLGFF